jgi:hypothetical protein
MKRRDGNHERRGISDSHWTRQVVGQAEGERVECHPRDGGTERKCGVTSAECELLGKK